jgi:hypothetical protein
MLEVYTTTELFSVVLFLWAKGLGAKDIHKKSPVYCGKCLLHKAVYNWVRKILSVTFKSHR